MSNPAGCFIQRATSSRFGPSYCAFVFVVVPAMSSERASSSDGATGAGDNQNADVITKAVASMYRTELATGRSSRGKGASLDDSQMVVRLVRLRRRSATLHGRYRLADAKILEQLEKGLPGHVTVEANRVISALATEIRAVGDAVGAVHDDLRSFMSGKVVLAAGTSPVEELAAISQAQAALANRKRAVATVIKEDRGKAAEARRTEKRAASDAKKAEQKKSAEEKRMSSSARASSSSGPVDKKRRASTAVVELPAKVEETAETLRAFLDGLERTDDVSDWVARFDRDVKKELQMTTRARLNREDHRRRFLDGLLMKAPRGRNRDVLQTAFYEVESRRRGLLNQMTYEEQLAYNRALEEEDAARSSSVASADPAQIPPTNKMPEQPEPTTSRHVSAESKPAKTAATKTKPRRGLPRLLLASDDEGDVGDQEGSGEEEEMSPGVLPDDPHSDLDGADSDEEMSTGVLPPTPVVFAEPSVEEKPVEEERVSVEEKSVDAEKPTGEEKPVAADPLDVDEFNKLMEQLDATGEFPSWVEKYAHDAEKESSGSLSTLDRLRRECWRRQTLSVRSELWQTYAEKMSLARALSASLDRLFELEEALTPDETAKLMRWKTALTMHADMSPRVRPMRQRRSHRK